jgi:hypothetical protein
MLYHRRGVMVRLVSCLALASFAGLPTPSAVAAPHGGVTYSAAADFSAARNPNGMWRYLAAGSLLRYANKDCNALGMACRWNGKPVCNSAIVAKGKRAVPLSYMTVRVSPDHLIMDPESIANVAVRWTAPAGGTFRIRGDFLGIDTTGQNHPVAIRDNARRIFVGSIPSFGSSAVFNLTRRLNRGETIDFIVSTGRACTYLSTGLKATITML